VSSLWKLKASLSGLALLSIAACTHGTIGDGAPEGTTTTSEVGFTAVPAQMRRLLARQYVNSVREVLGDDAAAAATPPVDPQINGFQSIAASQLSMTNNLVREYELSARAVSSAAMGNTQRIATLLDCTPSGNADADCFTSFIDNLGRLVFRRNVTKEERADYLKLATRAAEQFDDFYTGAEYVILAMLQSPNFVYQVEFGTAGVENGGTKLSGNEIATRMAFFLTDTTPSAELLDAAERGELDTAEGVRAAAIALMSQPLARKAVRAFFREYLVLDGLETLPKDPAVFPSYSRELAASMQQETLLLLEDIIFNREASTTELFTADYTFVDKRLASHYGVQAPHPDVTWTKASLPLEQGRAGILSHASVLSRQAHSESTSATYRGLFVFERFLCRAMPPPPDDVVTELPESSKSPTLRDRLAVHLENPVCAACHEEVDKVGLALENFDGIGQWRERENGALIDASATIKGIGSFDGVKELAQLLASREDTMQCVLRNVYRHATGHVETSGEQEALDELGEHFIASDYNFKTMLVDMVSSDLFRTVGVIEP
jgi:hypothetical protein